MEVHFQGGTTVQIQGIRVWDLRPPENRSEHMGEREGERVLLTKIKAIVGLRASGCLPQVGADKDSETRTPDSARTQKQMSPGWMTHCDSSSSLETVTPVPCSLGLASDLSCCSRFKEAQTRPSTTPLPLHTGGHSRGPAAASGADSLPGDIGEKPACPVPSHPKAGFRFLWSRAPGPASPRG